MAAFPGRPGGTNPMDVHPLNESFSYLAEVIASGADGMYATRRDFNTRLRQTIQVTYDKLATSDLGLIRTHFESVGLGESFAWIDREDVSYTVYYAEPPQWSFFVEGFYTLAPLSFVEV